MNVKKSLRVKKEVVTRRHLVLPPVPTVSLNLIKDRNLRNAYAYALRIEGWTLQSIADALGVSRERIRQIETTAKPSDVLTILADPGQYPVPKLPTIEIEVAGPPIYVEPSPETLARLLELQPLAQKVRYDHKAYRAEGEEYSALVWYAHSVEGVTLYRLAKRLGVTHGALRFRLARYGYIIPKEGKSPCYTPIKQKNRAVTK
jgi:transcriptional regulator with XRE-family HTH domain